MSRHNTPYPEIGRLAIGVKTAVSNSEMPATTRSAAQRRQASSGAGAGASSRATAGPSRTTPGSGVRRASRQPARQQRAAARPGPKDDDDDDDSESSDDGDGSEDDEENGTSIVDEVNEIYSVFADTYPTPSEFSRIDQPSTRDERDEVTAALTTPLTRHLRRLAAHTARVVTNLPQHPQVMDSLREAVPKDFRVQQLVANVDQRFNRIRVDLHNNVNVSAAQGRNVPQTVDHCRWLYNAIANLLQSYANNLREADKATLVRILIQTLQFLTEQDVDRYEQSPVARPDYASTSSGGNLYRRWLSAQGKPLVFLQVLNRIPLERLRTHRNDINNIRGRVAHYNVGASNQQLFQQVAQGLHTLSAHLFS